MPRSVEQLERVDPVLTQEARDAPEHAQWLDRTGCLDRAHIGRLPAELIENAAHGFLRRQVIAADEHGGLAALEPGIDHAGVAYGVERFDEAHAFEFTLKPLHQRFIE